MIRIGITDHLEGPRRQPSAQVYAEVGELVRLADEIGIDYFWFAEHHAHAHQGHLPAPLLLALHLAGQTTRIRLGTAIICLNLHHPLAVAEQVAIADTLSGGRLAIGFGSGSTPEEFNLFGLEETSEPQRHARFAEALRIIGQAWEGGVAQTQTPFFNVPAHEPLPVALPDLAERCWLAANSREAARIAGEFGFNMLFSHLRTPDEYWQFTADYGAAGGNRLIAANRPVFVGPDDRHAFELAEPALRTLWRRFQAEGKIAANVQEPRRVEELCGHPLNFLVGSAGRVAGELRELHAVAAFDVANLEVRWAGMSPELVRDNLYRVGTELAPLLREL